MFQFLPEAWIVRVTCRCSDSLIPFAKSYKRGNEPLKQVTKPSYKKKYKVMKDS